MDSKEFKPDWVVPPGATIADLLEERGLSQCELAQCTGFTEKYVNLLINGNAMISEDIAIRLELFFGIKSQFWLNRESMYRDDLINNLLLRK